ncbi:hypothetical protein V2J09_021644 [Rumex salicifolius]
MYIERLSEFFNCLLDVARLQALKLHRLYLLRIHHQHVRCPAPKDRHGPRILRPKLHLGHKSAQLAHGKPRKNMTKGHVINHRDKELTSPG